MASKHHHKRAPAIVEAAAASGLSEIAFFDVDTTVPDRSGAGYSLLEFGAILVCPRRLVEVDEFSTLISPSDPNSISATFNRCNGITKENLATAPSFQDVADKIFNILHGRVWAGHNIVSFDCARIREAFAEIRRPAPEAKGIIDTLPLLTQTFGKRAGNMKMATLATYFGLGQQKHRSLDDVRMNLEVLKYCATVLFLESSLTHVFSANSLVSENTIIRIQDNEIASPSAARSSLNCLPDLSSNQHMDCKATEGVQAQAKPSTSLPDRGPSDLVAHAEQMSIDSSRRDTIQLQSPATQSPEPCAPIIGSGGYSGCGGFLEPDEVSMDHISASQIPSHYYGNMIVLLHRDVPLQICCLGIRVRFGIGGKFFDHTGRRKLNIVVDVPANLCQILDFCDRIAEKSSLDSGSSSEWKPVILKNRYSNSSSIRLHITTIANAGAAIYLTEICKKEPSGDNQKLVFSKLDTAVLEQLFNPGTIIDAYFSLDVYDFQQNAGIRLVAKRLVVHPL